jgi:hypothetical protein
MVQIGNIPTFNQRIVKIKHNGFEHTLNRTPYIKTLAGEK